MATASRKVIDRENITRCIVCSNACLMSAKADNYYTNKYSSIYASNETFLTVCKDCCERIFTEAVSQMGLQTAVKICCHYFDYYYSDSAFEKFDVDKTNSKFENYVKIVSKQKVYSGKTFVDSLMDMMAKADTAQQVVASVDSEKGITYSKTDHKNRMRILEIYKYDPFDGADEEDKKRMYNLCSDYLVDDDFINDSHKLQGVLELVKSYNQLHHINKKIDQMAGDVKDPKLFDSLVAAKRSIMTTINQFAKDNGISASLSSKGVKGSSSLSYQVKMLDDIHFTDAEINLFDVETCKSFRQTADISNKSILAQLYLTDDEKLAMVADQSKTILELRKLAAALKEQNRLMTITLNNLGKSIPLKSEVDDALTEAGFMIEAEGAEDGLHSDEDGT